MDPAKHNMEPIDVKDILDRMVQRDDLIDEMERRHYQKAYKELIAAGKEEKKEEPILRKHDGTPFLLNVFGYEELLEVRPIFLTELEGKLTKTKFQELLMTYGKKLELKPLQFERIFHMTDLDMDEMVSWGDFMRYLNQELREREILSIGITPDPSGDPIQDSPKYVHNRHGHIISSVIFWPSLTKDKKLDYSVGRYVTSSRDGFIDFWNLDMKHLYSANAFSAVPLKITPTCITKIVPMPDINMICVCCMDREIRFYDAVADNFRLRTVINDFQYGLVTMEYHFYDTDSVKSWLAVGDTQGNIFAFTFSPNAATTLFSQVVGLPFVSVRYSQVVLGAMEGLSALEFPNVHPTWIETMAYYEQFLSLVTTCNNPKSAVVFINVHSNCILVRIDVSPGVTCAAALSRDRDEPWEQLGVLTGDLLKRKESRFSHYLVTGGFRSEIKIWDLDRPRKPKTIIEGRASKLILILVDEENHTNPWIYTYAREGIITIWDANTKACLQEFKDNLDHFGPYSPLALCYNPYFKVLVVAAFKICYLKIRRTINMEYNSGHCHEREVTVALFNYLYDLVVTCGADSIIMTWNAFTGKRVFAWKNAHSADILTDIVDYGITSGTFNPDQSLLATGATDGSIKIWNFHTGECLRKMELDRGAVLKVIWLKTRLFGVGFECSYREWDPLATGDSEKELAKKFSRTVTAACFVPPVTIITGDIFGEILFCNYSSGKIYKRYYVHEPFRNLTMRVDYEAEQKNTRNIVFDKRRHYTVGGVATTAIHSIYYLRKRNQEPKEGNILVALDTGMIQVWSAHPKGALVSSFYAVHNTDDFIVRMESDMNNDYLFTGSSDGYLKLWLMKGFATAEESCTSVPKLRLMFAFLAKNKWNIRAKKGVFAQPKPMLLNSYRAHGMAITSIAFIDFCKLVITSGCDRSVRYWSLTGQFLNQLGSNMPWTPVDPRSIVVVKKLRVPPDLKRVVSSTTMRVLTNGYRLTEDGEREPVSTNLQATAHIHRRTTKRTPHGHSLGKDISARLKIPNISIKPTEPLVFDQQVDVWGVQKPYKMERVEMMDVPKPLQQKVKQIFMNSLEYAGVPKFRKTGEVKRGGEPTLVENIKNKLKFDAILKKVDAFVGEDMHPYVFGCKVREAITEGRETHPIKLNMGNNIAKYKYFQEPYGKYLWRQNKFEKDIDMQLKRERLDEMAMQIRKTERTEAQKRILKTNIEKRRRYTSNNLLNMRMRQGRMKSAVNRIRELEEVMANVAGTGEEAKREREALSGEIFRIQKSTFHDFTSEQRKAVGDQFWKPLFMGDESDLTDEESKEK